MQTSLLQGNLLEREFFVKTELFYVILFSDEIIRQISHNWQKE